LGLIGGLITAYLYFTKGNEIWIPLLVMALCIPLTAPMNLFVQINQSKKDFRLNAIYVLIKYAVIVPLCALLGLSGASIYWFFCSFFVLSAIINVLCLRRHREAFEPSDERAPQYRRESLQLSATGVFPQIVENLDKFIISYFFGLEALGIYTIGVSTGSLLLHFIKPTLTIYFPYLVEHRLTWKIFASGFLLMTLVGAVTIFFLQLYFDRFLGPEYEDAKLLAYIIVAGLGVSFLGVISYFSAVYHKEGSARTPAITNVVTAVFIATYLLCAARFGGDYALILCAISYPLRELVNLLVIQFINARKRSDLRVES
jgi:O-antigen/teichoic acid export membrane protein